MDRWMKKNYDFKSRRGILRWFLTCLTLFWMVFIFMMSSAGKDESNSQSGAVCEFICEHFVEGYEEMAPEEQIQMQQKISFPVRKCAHLSEYAVLGALMTLTAASWIRGGEALPALSFCPTTETTASWRWEREDAHHAWQIQADTAASWRRED
ncbi:MAG: VanZ family protein, partial [Lachnospiraceae bacterium]|nr:VanZ family protein [Lachnospiraceae bacterium]